MTSFSTPSNFTVGTNPYSVAVGDFNGDSIPDLVVANAGDLNPASKTVTVLIGDGVGGFTASTVPVGSTFNPINVFVGDFDGDGDDDIATANFDLPELILNPANTSPASDISILLNNGSGSFSAAAGSPFAVPDGLSAIALGDFNNDGILDVAAGALDNDDVSVYLGDQFGPLGTFDPTPFTYTIGRTTRSLDLGDLNGDGFRDLALVRSGDPNVYIRFGTGTDLLSGAPIFDPTETSFAVGAQPRSVKIVDINGDGDLDLVVANSADDNISVLLGNGDGTFGAATNYDVGNGSRAVAVADLDGNSSPDIVVANELDDTVSVLWNPIVGNGQNNLLRGGDGNDTLNGSGGNDTIFGGLGNDLLKGGTGADSLVGGAGDDRYEVDDLGDTVTEDVGGGIDLVTSSVNFTLGDNIENLILNGSANINGTGNSLDNEIYGNSGNNTLTGGAGNDTLRGGAGDDTLFGGDGNDTLVGGIGTDSLVGGAGDDTYIIDSLIDTIVEAAGGGTDTVRSSVDFTLASNLENLILSGTALNGSGNTLNNRIVANPAGNNILRGFGGNDTLIGAAGNDSLDGGAGNDTLFGGASDDTLFGASGNDLLVGGLGNDLLIGGLGNDVFRFNNPNEGIDTIQNFSSIDDTIEVSDTGFGGSLVAGVLDASAFVSGAGITTASNAAHRFIYNTSNGALFFDADGNGAGASIQLATLSGTLAINNTDIVIII
ncbi:FG-GAP-like repeat-containing protein [Anabaena sp. UHCC 0451]|uniref:FG-GAP-like repeat-containing protein n=1 Tax=Anabaena sp. UHCC 0451 TaxID=2055235 RepID=UPI002B20AC78|nr:FG-GAP-like repeat-containing protein [Anabaena sp. UHCC 0451]MEA5576630.1 FG-GAP-like repeat-containing protein [Anabaena sp. UHCC 0451]